MEHLWAPWRLAYVQEAGAGEGCVFCAEAAGDLGDAEAAEIHLLTVQAVAALTAVYAPEGFNVGWNLGAVAGGSITGHLHEHVVPRWGGDTNFMPVLADVKVLPEHLEATRARLTEVWPK